MSDHLMGLVRDERDALRARAEAAEAEGWSKGMLEAARICDNAPSKPNQTGGNREVESAHWCAAAIRAALRNEEGE